MGKLKTKEQLIAAFKKSNQERKEILANRAGFSTPEDYLKHLEKLPDVNPITGATTVETITGEKPVIHNVVILDASGSMDGSKFNNAVKGYNNDVENLKQSTDVVYKQSTIIFSSNKGNIEEYNVPIEEVRFIDSSLKANGGTPLYRYIDSTIKNLIKRKIVQNNDKVLMSIFTDGGDTEYGTTDDFGRVQFTDMEAARGNNPAFDGRQRLVDPRTLNWVIVTNVKYEIK